MGRTDARSYAELLHEQGLTGIIPPELGDLDRLEELLLTGNELSGEIPPELAMLDNLRYLWLERQQTYGAQFRPN